MSKKELTTRQFILATALQAFNRQGIEAVGVRDLAALLKLSAGNVTYYFPTREDLLKELVSDLDSSLRLLTDKVTITNVAEFISQQRLILDTQFHYRCLYLSYGTLMVFNKKAHNGLKKLDKQRTEQLKLSLQVLTKSTSLDKLDSSDLKAFLLLISNFSVSWVACVLGNNPTIKKDQAVKEALESFSTLISPYFSKKGKQDLAKALKSK
jgi:AcrR family transcriptional regulator